MFWVFPIDSTSIKKITEPSIIFLQNGVLILNGKESKEAAAICFEIRILKKKEQVNITESPIKNLWKKFYHGKKQKQNWFQTFHFYFNLGKLVDKNSIVS